MGPLIVIITIVLLWSHWEECYYAYKWTSELKIVYLHSKATVVKGEETVEWINFIVDKWLVFYSCIDSIYYCD